MHAEVCWSSNGHISSWISNAVTAQRCAQASLGPCTSLYPSSLQRQKLRMPWAKAIPVNSLFLHEKLVFNPSFTRCLQGRAREILSWCFSLTRCRKTASISLPATVSAHVFWSVFHRGLNEDINGAPLATTSSVPLKTNGPIIFAWRRALFFCCCIPGFSKGEEWRPIRTTLKYTKPFTGTGAFDCSRL